MPCLCTTSLKTLGNYFVFIVLVLLREYFIGHYLHEYYIGYYFVNIVLAIIFKVAWLCREFVFWEGLVSSYLVLSCRVVSVLFCLVLPCLLILSCLDLSILFWSGLVMSCYIMSCLLSMSLLVVFCLFILMSCLVNPHANNPNPCWSWPLLGKYINTETLGKLCLYSWLASIVLNIVKHVLMVFVFSCLAWLVFVLSLSLLCSYPFDLSLSHHNVTRRD